MTLRALAGARPRIRRLGEANRWDALLSCDRDLTLQGLDLAGPQDALAPIILGEGGRLRLVNCKLDQRGTSPAVSLRRGAGVEVERSEIWAHTQAIAVELDGARVCAVRLDRSRLEVHDTTGPALLLWCPEVDPQARADVRLSDCDIQTGRVIACRCVGGAVHLEADRNTLAFRQALVSFEGGKVRDDWRRVVSYQGRHNRHDTAGAWLWLEGRSGNVWSEEAWASLWPAGLGGTAAGSEIASPKQESSLQSAIRR